MMQRQFVDSQWLVRRALLATLIAALLIGWLLPACVAPADEPTQAPDAPAPLTDAAKRMRLPPGFRVTLFAGEPDVVQPIAFTFDDRGRMWVVECLSYPKWVRQGMSGPDRITILEDSDDDGVADIRTVFLEAAANLSGIEYGHGGVWVTAIPNLLFIPDRNRDDKPDGPAEIKLDGWSMEAVHNVVNGLKWGPDGWLYGCNGILSKSRVGVPGTSDDKRVSLDCGVWRFDPLSNRVQAIAHGTTNPWGLDYNDHGQWFVTNCVIKHLFHFTPGGHYKRMFGNDINPHSYALIDSCADHIHWAGGDWTSARGNPVHSDAGGGHAHSGAAVYLADEFPAEYRDNIFMCNIHGNRLNRDRLNVHASGYVASHAPDFLMAHDPWFRGIAVQQGPHGRLFVSDWCDTGECHNYEVAHTTSGRIYRIEYGEKRNKPVDLAAMSNMDLINRVTSRDEFVSRRARRLLHERSSDKDAAVRPKPAQLEGLTDLVLKGKETASRLRALWSIELVNGSVHGEVLKKLIVDPDPHLRAWAIRLSTWEQSDGGSCVHHLGDLVGTDRFERDPFVLRELAAALPIVAEDDRRWKIAEGIAAQTNDEHDPQLSLMLWYGIEPSVAKNPDAAIRFAAASQSHRVRQFVAQRLVRPNPGENAPSQQALRQLLVTVASNAYPTLDADFATGMSDGWSGVRKLSLAEEPRALAQTAFRRLSTSVDPAVRMTGHRLSLMTGDGDALETLRAVLANSTANAAERRAALTLLVDYADATAKDVARSLLDSPGELRRDAIRALAAFSSNDTPKQLLAVYGNLNVDEKNDAIATLASRPEYARELVEALEAGTIPRRDVGVLVIRQLIDMKVPEITAGRLEKAWGTLRSSAPDRAARFAELKSKFPSGVLSKANPAKGAALFERNCAACHKLYGKGGDLGPELTGSQRTSIDYLLENVLDPSAVVAGDYKPTTLELKSGRVVSGLIGREDDQSITIRNANETLTIAKSEIEERAKSTVSFMPEGLLDNLSEEEMRDLLGYLSSTSPPPAVSAGGE